MTRTKTKANTRKKRPVAVDLPEHITLTDGELAVVTRLVRLMRMDGSPDSGAYWLGPFIEFLLYRDFTDPDLNFVTPRVAREVINTLGESNPCFGKRSSFFKAILKNAPGISFVSSTTVRPAGLRGWTPWLPEDDFYELVRMWRMDHPEPPPKREFPRGVTQHESDPDSD